jgi:uncharacterized membrane protein (UPF0182 family)
MPQLKKVVLAMGNTLIYRDTYEQALADLGAGMTTTTSSIQPPAETTAASAAAAPAASPPKSAQAQSAGDPRVQTMRDHLRRYRELSAQGRWSEAGRELEALEKLLAR